MFIPPVFGRRSNGGGSHYKPSSRWHPVLYPFGRVCPMPRTLVVTLRKVRRSFSILNESGIALCRIGGTSYLPLNYVLFPFQYGMPSIFGIAAFRLSPPTIFPPRCPYIAPPESDTASRFENFDVFDSLGGQVPFGGPPTPLLLHAAVTALFSPSYEGSFVLTAGNLSRTS